MAYVFRHSICNEAFEGWKFADACKAIRKAGYTGIEIAPFTLAERPADVAAEQRREYSGIIRSEGLEFVGLHWLMVSPKGLHVTTPDTEARARGWEHIWRTAHCLPPAYVNRFRAGSHRRQDPVEDNVHPTAEYSWRFGACGRLLDVRGCWQPGARAIHC